VSPNEGFVLFYGMHQTSAVWGIELLHVMEGLLFFEGLFGNTAIKLNSVA
jgi:hypothetical protein